MRGALSDLAQQQTDIQEQGSVRSNGSAEKLSTMQQEVNTTRQLVDKMNQNITVWVAEERKAMDEERESWKEEVSDHRTDRKEGVEDLKKLLHEAGVAYLSKFDSFTKEVSARDDASKVVMQQMIENFRSTLDQHLQTEQSKAENEAKETQRVLIDLQDQIGVMREQLEHKDQEMPSQDVSSDHNTQEDETASLRERILQLEKEVSKTNDLQTRWHTDIETVDSIRTKLKSLQHLPSQVNAYNEQLATILQLSNLVDATSCSLVEHDTWVQQQLGTSHGKVDTIVVTPPGTAMRSHSTESINVKNPTETFGGETRNGTTDDLPGTTHQNRSDIGSRRVQVHSPAELHSPSSPPSIEQEQKRRRVPVSVRPILKASSLSSSQESTVMHQSTAETETELGPVQESSKPVATMGNANMSSHRSMLAEISSGFIVDKSDVNAFTLPRITDFQHGGTIQQNPASPNKQKREVRGYDEPSLKRVKMLKSLKQRQAIEPEG